MAYTGEARFRFEGPRELCIKYVRPARVLAEFAMRAHGVGDDYGSIVPAATMSRVLDDGTYIRVSVFDDNIPIITIRPVAGGAVSKHEVIDTTYFFYSENVDAEHGAYYRPHSVNDALDGLEDDGGGLEGTLGSWRTRTLPEPNNWMGKRLGRYFSTDIRVTDGQPRWITEWEDRAPHGVDRGNGEPFVLSDTYHINGKPVTAPGGLIGAMKDNQQDSVFVADTSSGVTIERYDWVVDEITGESDWELAWSSIVSSTDTVAGIANTMRIRADGLEAAFAVLLQFIGATSASDSATLTYPALYTIDLSDGTLTNVYGDSSQFPLEDRGLRLDIVDTDVPDHTAFALWTNDVLEASVDTTTTLTGEAGNTDFWRTMPAVGDRFIMGSFDDLVVHDDSTADGSSVIEISSVTYTPKPFTTNGKVFSGSTEPHLSKQCTVNFTWVKAGTEDDGGGGTQNVTYPADTRIEYTSQVGALELDYTREDITTIQGEHLAFYGYELSGTLVYTKVVVDETDTIVDTGFTTASGVTRENTADFTSVTTLEVVGGQHDLLSIRIGDLVEDDDGTEGVSNVTFASDDSFSGVNFTDASGTVDADEFALANHPEGAPVSSNAAVSSSSTDGVVSGVEAVTDFVADAVYFDFFGETFFWERGIAASSIALSSYIDLGVNLVTEEDRGRRLRITGSEAVTHDDLLSKFVFTQDAWHKGVRQARWRLVDTQEKGAGAGTDTDVEIFGVPTQHLSQASFDASAGLTSRYTDSFVVGNIGLAGGFLATDPYHSVVAVVDRWHLGVSGPQWTLRQDSNGFLWRSTDDNPETDPRALFATPDPSLNVYPVAWGAIITDITREERTHETESEAQDTRTLQHTRTFRRS